MKNWDNYFPTLVHFGVVCLIALLALSPESDSLIAPFGLIGIAGLGYSLSITLRRARHDRSSATAWLLRGGIPIICYLGIIAAARLGVVSSRQAYSLLGAVAALLLLAGMRNSWADAVDIARRKNHR